VVPQLTFEGEPTVADIYLVRTAGTYAEARYQRGLRRWRRRSVRRLLPGFLVLDLAVLTLGFLTGGGAMWFMAGGVVGATTMGLLVVWDRPEDSVLNWGRGAEGERLTGTALKPLLEEGWRVKHDIQLRRENIDHLLTGPAGTFLLETKWPRGRVSIEAGLLVTRPLDDPEGARRTNLHRQIDRQLTALRHGCVPGVRKVKSVQPIVVIWSDFEQRVHESGGIVYLHGDELVPWLRSRLAPALEPFAALS
jgi:Nuclease-related domain